MANENEPAKLLLPYLQRADELQNHDPLVAYYCRLYAMERGLKFPQSERTKTTNSLLISLMKQLEKDKKTLKLGPDDQLHLEGFALNVFEKADKQDRAGRSNLNTAKTFYAASIFFEILNQFGDLQPDLEQKQKYAAWKAADIRKAIKEGRTPVAGPPGGDEDFSILTSASSGEYDVEQSLPDPPLHPPAEFYNKVPPQHTSDISSPTSDNFSPPPPPRSNSFSPPPPPPPPSNNSPPPPPPRSNSFSSPPPPPSNNSPPPPPPPPSYPSSNHPSHDVHPSQNNTSEDTSYPQTYHHQPYPQEPHQHIPQNYPSQSYPNFQSYPSFTESSIPTAPSHYPSYYQGSDSAQYNNSPHNELPPAPSKPTPIIQNQHMYTQGDSSGRNGSGYDSVPAPVQQTYQYDSSYQPSPDKIAESHKAARFAVGALAFDDVPTAVDFLKKSLELLTNPSAGH